MFKFLLGLIFPDKCLMCGDIIANDHKAYFCDACEPFLPLIDEAHCLKCGRPFEYGDLCPACRDHAYAFTANRAAALYDSKMRGMILRFKYGRHMEYGSGLGRLMALRYADFFGEAGDTRAVIDFIMPVPLHRKRRAWRGFNQAELLAAAVAAEVGAPLIKTALVRVRNTKPQSSLEPTKRVKNIKNAFKLRKVIDIKGKNILLIDDIFTTGSTLSVCAALLIANGAANVYGYTLSITSLQ